MKNLKFIEKINTFYSVLIMVLSKINRMYNSILSLIFTYFSSLQSYI